MVDIVNRRLDELGRITIPADMRQAMGISERDALTVKYEEGKIVISKYEKLDVFDGRKHDEFFEYMGKQVSKDSIVDLAKLAGLI